MDKDSAYSIAELREKVREFCKVRDWEQFHAPKNLSMAISAESAELMEHFLWLSEQESRDSLKDSEEKEKVAAELADILIYCLQFANISDIDIADAVLTKMKINEQRFPK